MLNVYCVRTFPRCGLTHLYGTTTNSSTGSHTGPHALSNTSSTLVRVREILPIMCDSWQSTHVPTIAIHVVTFYSSITRGSNETGESTVSSRRQEPESPKLLQTFRGYVGGQVLQDHCSQRREPPRVFRQATVSLGSSV